MGFGASSIMIRTIRIIGRCDVKWPFVIKGINFDGLKKVSPVRDYLFKLADAGAHEIFIYDCVASLYSLSPQFESLKDALSSPIYLPITYGGGLKNIEDVHRAFDAGIDKVALNTGAVDRIELVSEVASIYGSQATVISIDAKNLSGSFWVFCQGGKECSGYKISEWIRAVEDAGAGEIIVTSIDNDGTGRGLNKKLVEVVGEVAKVPVIFGGGLSNENDLTQLFDFQAITGISTATGFQSDQVDLGKLNSFIQTHVGIGMSSTAE
ncbi:HisA/HisF-related TIM barrel protein [Litorivicinus sp.]|nr:HisA/HisF-related TIM barrel protein [Litorivicinus sp.]